MKVKVTKVGVTFGHSVVEIGGTLNLADKDAQRLIDAGYAEAVASGKPKGKAPADDKKADDKKADN